MREITGVNERAVHLEPHREDRAKPCVLERTLGTERAVGADEVPRMKSEPLMLSAPSEASA